MIARRSSTSRPLRSDLRRQPFENEIPYLAYDDQRITNFLNCGIVRPWISKSDRVHGQRRDPFDEG